MGDYGSTHAPHSKEDAQRRAWKAAESRYGKVVHGPLNEDGVFECCGKRPDEVPRWHRVAILMRDSVTCGKEQGDG